MPSTFGIGPATSILVACEDRIVFTSRVRPRHRTAHLGLHDILGDLHSIRENCTPGSNPIDPIICVGPQSEPRPRLATVAGGRNRPEV